MKDDLALITTFLWGISTLFPACSQIVACRAAVYNFSVASIVELLAYETDHHPRQDSCTSHKSIDSSCHILNTVQGAQCQAATMDITTARAEGQKDAVEKLPGDDAGTDIEVQKPSSVANGEIDGTTKMESIMAVWGKHGKLIVILVYEVPNTQSAKEVTY